MSYKNDIGQVYLWHLIYHHNHADNTWQFAAYGLIAAEKFHDALCGKDN